MDIYQFLNKNNLNFISDVGNYYILIYAYEQYCQTTDGLIAFSIKRKVAF